jgi:hypothetical protein
MSVVTIAREYGRSGAELGPDDWRAFAIRPTLCW